MRYINKRGHGLGGHEQALSLRGIPATVLKQHRSEIIPVDRCGQRDSKGIGADHWGIRAVAARLPVGFS